MKSDRHIVRFQHNALKSRLSAFLPIPDIPKIRSYYENQSGTGRVAKRSLSQRQERPIAAFVVSFTLAGSAMRRSKMSYQTDSQSRTRAIAMYVTLLMIGAALGFLVRFGVITDHMLW